MLAVPNIPKLQSSTVSSQYLRSNRFDQSENNIAGAQSHRSTSSSRGEMSLQAKQLLNNCFYGKNDKQNQKPSDISNAINDPTVKAQDVLDRRQQRIDKRQNIYVQSGNQLERASESKSYPSVSETDYLIHKEAMLKASNPQPQTQKSMQFTNITTVTPDTKSSLANLMQLKSKLVDHIVMKRDSNIKMLKTNIEMKEDECNQMSLNNNRLFNQLQNMQQQQNDSQEMIQLQDQNIKQLQKQINMDKNDAESVQFQIQEKQMMIIKEQQEQINNLNIKLDDTQSDLQQAEEKASFIDDLDNQNKAIKLSELEKDIDLLQKQSKTETKNLKQKYSSQMEQANIEIITKDQKLKRIEDQYKLISSEMQEMRERHLEEIEEIKLEHQQEIFLQSRIGR